ncbi:MAG TPA: hypothetical protein VM618_02690, partial [Acidimicrobiia bacterium]|nr:hypothetical protein [Acidimicrobiia bacterium]
RHAFANYWVAYPLTYIGDGRVEVAAADQNRWVEQYLDVSAAPTSAWLFTAEERRDEAAEVFHVSIAGPFGVDRARFEAMLGAAGIAYEVRRAGLVDAVVPARPVTGTDVGLPPPFWD